MDASPNHVFGSLDSWISRLNMEEEYGIYKREGYLDSEDGKRHKSWMMQQPPTSSQTEFAGPTYQ